MIFLEKKTYRLGLHVTNQERSTNEWKKPVCIPRNARIKWTGPGKSARKIQILVGKKHGIGDDFPLEYSNLTLIDDNCHVKINYFFVKTVDNENEKPRPPLR